MHERPAPRFLTFGLLAALLSAALAVGTAVTRAQAPDPVQPGPESGTDEARAQGGERGPEPASPVDAAGQPPGPLEDYEASEQISEDLSVAFPVDI